MASRWLSLPFEVGHHRGSKRRVKLRGMTPWVALGVILSAVVLPMSIQAEAEEGEGEMTISEGSTVSIEYTLRLEDKEVVDSNVGSEPLTYVHGSHQIISGLEKALEGMKIGDSKKVTINPEEGYGPVIQEAFVEVKKEQIPQDALKIDTQLQGRDANGRDFTARVAEIKDTTVVLDFNHPLAGRTLFFDVKVLEIEKASTK